MGNRFHEETIWKILEIEGYYHNAFKKKFFMGGWGVDGNCVVTSITGIIIVVLFGSTVRRLC